MNDIENALEYFGDGRLWNCHQCPSFEDATCTESQAQTCNYYKLAIQALKKQIPKKPIFKDGIASHYHCPTCGRLYWDRGDSNECCDLCGQRLEW